MKTSIVDLRYKMKDVLKALNRRERIEILYHGRPKGVINPVHEPKTLRIRNHPFFGMLRKQKKSVRQVMDELRGGRHGAI